MPKMSNSLEGPAPDHLGEAGDTNAHQLTLALVFRLALDAGRRSPDHIHGHLQSLVVITTIVLPTRW